MVSKPIKDPKLFCNTTRCTVTAIDKHGYYLRSDAGKPLYRKESEIFRSITPTIEIIKTEWERKIRTLKLATDIALKGGE